MEKEIWLARDKNDSLFLYIGYKPQKFSSSWRGVGITYVSVRLGKEQYPEVKWSDDEPTKVKLVIDK